jgi:hypothetical protein
VGEQLVRRQRIFLTERGAEPGGDGLSGVGELGLVGVVERSLCPQIRA